MKEFVLFVNGQTVGPLRAEEIEAHLASGEYSPETPCAEPGASDWKTLKDFFPTKKTVRIAKKTQEEEAEMKTATTEKLDPDVRKKLLLYNLADAISVDKFTPIQADVAIRIHEEAQTKEKRIKIAAGVSGFLLSFLLAFLFFSYVNVGAAPGGRGQKIFECFFEKPVDPDLNKKLRRVLGDAARLKALREEAAAVKFLKPRGQGEPRSLFLGNVEIKNPDVSTVTGTLDLTTLAGKIPPSLRSTAKIEMIQLSRLDSQTEELIDLQGKLFAICSVPLWTDKELRAAIARELSTLDFPLDPNIPESMDIYKRIKAFRVADVEHQLAWLVKRTGELSRSPELYEKLQAQVLEKIKKKPELPKEKLEKRSRGVSIPMSMDGKDSKLSKTSAWAAGKMPAFVEIFAEFLSNNILYYSPEARKTVWGEFVKNEFPKIKEAIDKNEKQRVPTNEKGEFLFDGRNMRNIIAIAQLPNVGEIYFVPMTDAENDADKTQSNRVVIQELKVNRKLLTPEDVLMDERYKVSSKEKVGGVPVSTSGKLLSRDVFIVRTTPEWFYIEVEKVHEDTSSRKSKVLLLVSQGVYESLAVGDEIPMERLLTFERYSRPAESPSTGRLIPIDADQFEIIKEAQEEVGIAFPPPPEKQSAQEPEKKEEPAEAQPPLGDVVAPNDA